MSSTPQAMGGRARARTLGPDRRRQIARKAAAARWGSKPRATAFRLSEIRLVAKQLAAWASYPAAIRLFGSYARGTAGPSSDVDLMVVENGLRDWSAESARLRRLLRANQSSLARAVDLVVVSRADYRKWRGCYGTVQHEADREGILLVE